LLAARAHTVLTLRHRLAVLGADPAALTLLDVAAEADTVLEDVLTNDSPTTTMLGTVVLPQAVADVLEWPLRRTPPRVLAGVLPGSRRLVPPSLSAAERARFITNLQTIAESAAQNSHANVLALRQACYLVTVDHSTSTDEWLQALWRRTNWLRHAGSFEPRWAESRSVAMALARQGDGDALHRFLAAGRDDDSFNLATLNYHAYWIGEIGGPQTSDAFMGRSFRWRGTEVLDHLTDRLDPAAPSLPLHAHAIGALITARRGILEDDPALSRRLADRVAVLLDGTPGGPDERRSLEGIRTALRLAETRV
jgi:hypothetical protein